MDVQYAVARNGDGIGVFFCDGRIALARSGQCKVCRLGCGRRAGNRSLYDDAKAVASKDCWCFRNRCEAVGNAILIRVRIDNNVRVCQRQAVRAGSASNRRDKIKDIVGVTIVSDRVRKRHDAARRAFFGLIVAEVNIKYFIHNRLNQIGLNREGLSIRFKRGSGLVTDARVSRRRRCHRQSS